MTSFEIPADTRAKQHAASNPNQSVWVSANAGAGKTHVLASRVIRLLLQGVAPARILCLTFTKAAAANMAARVFDTLALWTQLSGDGLCAQIVATGAPMPGRQELTAARKLFARTVETPGGLKIQTIHAFCERLLHLFPFEANVPSRFEVPDEMCQAELLQRARREVLAEANSGKGALGAAVQRLADECGPEAFEDLVKETMKQSAILRAPLLREPAEILRRSLGLGEGRDIARIEREMAEDGIAPARWDDLAAMFDSGKPEDQSRANHFRKALAAYRLATPGGCLSECVDCYLAIYFIDKGKGSKAQRLLTNGLLTKHSKIGTELYAEQERLDALRAERKAVATLDRTRALIEVASAIFKRYRDEKAARGVLDFDDLIEKTLALLERSDACWVLYKLDSGIDHVLVDEAQDTSEAQWKILEELTGDFAAGRGQKPGPRTLFAVGDEKQSIFSFQGAAPHMFDKMRRKFETQFTAGVQPFAHVPLTLSFRSAPGVLSAIDKVFERGDHKNGLGDVWMPHEAVKHQLPGLVELWPPAAAQSGEDFREWTLPLDFLDAKDPANLVAQRVATKIKHLIEPHSNEFVHDSQTLRRRPVRPGDILILVRKRGAFFEAMIRTLKKSQISAAGADRLELTHHIAVMDLMAAGRASLLPQDDLALACVLKSPLIGLDDDDLMTLAPRRAASLFDALQASADANHSGAISKLARWRARAGGSPFDFYAGLLGADGGRRDLEARLGPEAGDAIDEFLRLAIAHEDARAPSLAAFLDDLAGLEYSIKRDMEGAEDAVRVMTIHAAKGLEAKIVFLPDSCGVLSPHHDPGVFVLGTKVPGEQTIGWSPRKDLDCEAIAAAREKAREAAMEEYRRLLYVALTRAEERLYIAGFHGAKEPDPGCWAKMIKAALANEAGIQMVPAFWNGEDQILRLISEGSGASAAALPDGRAAATPAAAVPDWLWRGAECETNAMPPVRPSHAVAPAHRLDGTGAAQARHEAARRGRLMHLLLQYLPGIAVPHRRDAALAFLAARAPGLNDTVRQDLAGEVLKVIALPELAGLFGQDSRAEVSVAGRITLGQRMIDVDGRVDRIGENQNEILAADYKTGAPCPLDGTPAAYLAQMALYRAVLAPLWPDKTLRMLLIWTAGPRVVWLPAGMLDAALAALAAG